MESDQNQSQVEVQPRADTQPGSLVELVEGTKNHQLYRKGEESRNVEVNGREIYPIGFARSRILSINERLSRRDETFDDYKHRIIGMYNPDPSYYNAFLVGEEEGVDRPKVSVSYFRIHQPS